MNEIYNRCDHCGCDFDYVDMKVEGYESLTLCDICQPRIQQKVTEWEPEI